MGIYAGVSGIPTPITEIYVGVAGVPTPVTAVYVGVAGIPTLVWSAETEGEEENE